METVGYILAALTLVYLWDRNMIAILTIKRGLSQVPRNKFCAYISDHKPFNCSTCQCVWIGLILFFIFDYQIFFLPLPLYYGLINKHL